MHAPDFALIPDLEEVGELLGVNTVPAEKRIQSYHMDSIIRDLLLLRSQLRRVELVI